MTTVFLRNLHPTRRLALPLAGGTARLVPPCATTGVARATAVRSPAVAMLLQRGLIALVDVSSRDPEIRQRRAELADMTLLIEAARQKECRALVGSLFGQQHMPRPQHVAVRPGRPEQAMLAATARKLSVPRRAVLTMLDTEQGLRSELSPELVNIRPTARNADYATTRRRRLAAKAVLAAAQTVRDGVGLAEAAWWLIVGLRGRPVTVADPSCIGGRKECSPAATTGLSCLRLFESR